MELELHFVAFIDVLGFAKMVRADCEAPLEDVTNLALLREVHEQTKTRLAGANGYSLVQFSDSVVLSRPFNTEALPEFLDLVAGFQRDLVVRKLLCRGGVAYGKHFSDGSFMFSQGLIDAYRLEQEARYPRIVVSPELLELLVPTHVAGAALPILKADDNLTFVDFVDAQSLPPALETAKALLKESRDPAVREKALWLARYLEHRSGKDGFAPAHFRALE